MGTTTKIRVARHEIRDEIQRRILSGESKPGERLSQQSLARELGVAQGTVRESLFELNWLGLVRSVDHLGVFVDHLDVSAICGAYLVREVLDGLAARLACSNVGKNDLAQLREIANSIYELSPNNDGESSSLDRGFHLRISDLSRNDMLIRLSQSYRVLGLAVRAYRDPKIVHAEHMRLIDALEHNFPEEAERLARSHAQAARLKIEEKAAGGDFKPEWVK